MTAPAGAGAAAQQISWEEVVGNLIVNQNAIREGLAGVAAGATRIATARDRDPNPASFLKPPRYDGTSDGNTWSTFREQFVSYASMRWGDEPTEAQIVQQKKTCYLCIGKAAARLLAGLGPTSTAFAGAATLDAYLTLLTNTFRPTSEINLARQRFKQRKQDPKESIQLYANSKQELYQHAYEAEYTRGEVSILIEEFIQGIYNIHVFEAVSNNAPYTTIQEAINAALKTVAVQRTSVRQGRRKDEGGLMTSVFQVDSDHLRFGGATSTPAANTATDVPIPMEVGMLQQMGTAGEQQEGDYYYYDESDQGYDSFTDEAASILQEDPSEALALLCEHLGALSASGFNGNCYLCDLFGHSARYCPTKPRGRGRRGGRGRVWRGRGGPRRAWGRGRGGGRGTSLPARNSANGRFLPSGTTYKSTIGQMGAEEDEDQETDGAAGTGGAEEQDGNFDDGLN